MATKIRVFDQLDFSSGQSFTVPYGTVFFPGDGAPGDDWLEVSIEAADTRNLDGVFRSALAYVQRDNAARRKNGLPTFIPVAVHERASIGPRDAHFIRIVIDFGACEWRLPLAVYDPARDTVAEGEDLDTTADNCAAMMSSALEYYGGSDVVLNYTGGVRSATEG